ncbi:MAG: N-formylglutamate amidohydrolase [Parvibaculaceae bacterium]
MDLNNVSENGPEAGFTETESTRSLSHPRADFDRPFETLAPRKQTLPFVLNSPHSGRVYPKRFLESSSLDALTLRRSEDSFVDEIFAGAVELGAPLLRAHFPRAYLDVNREPYELDPSMFADPLPPHVNTRSLRVAGGLGTIARVVAESTEIYRGRLPYSEAEGRIRHIYMPFHQTLRELLEKTYRQFGEALLIDCHSMPSTAGPFDEDIGTDRPDIVLGDRYGTACAPALVDMAEEILRAMGYTVSRNNPYAGGFNTEHYGAPARGLHALQIEINRALYMNERKVQRLSGITRLSKDMTRFVRKLGREARKGLLTTGRRRAS